MRLIGLSQTCLVITSTVERATEAQRILHHLGASSGIRTGLSVSPSALDEQMMINRLKPQILATIPQVAIDLLTLRIIGAEGSIKLLIVDQADAMLAIPPQAQLLRRIIGLLPPSKPKVMYDPWWDSIRVLVESYN